MKGRKKARITCHMICGSIINDPFGGRRRDKVCVWEDEDLAISEDEDLAIVVTKVNGDFNDSWYKWNLAISSTELN